MKKTIITLLLTISILNLSAQVIEDFENWSTFNVGALGPVQLTEPAGWTGSDSFIVGYGKGLNFTGTFQAQVFQENPGQTGSGAIRLASKFQDDIATYPAKVYPCIATNSRIALDIINGSFSQVGGTLINGKAVSTSMQVKTALIGGDSTFITAVLIDDSDGGDSVIAFADTLFSSDISAYTQVNLPFTYLDTNTVPTIVRYTISSGNPLAFLDSTGTFSVTDGTEIVVDNININFPTGLTQQLNNTSIASVYPTLAKNTLYVDLNEYATNYRLEIYNISGQVVFKKELNEKFNKINVSSLCTGNYIYSIVSNNAILQNGKITK